MSKDILWRLEDHVCKSCFGRVISRPVMDAVGQRLYRCTNCGHEAQGDSVSAICCCGVKLRKQGRDGSKAAATLIDAGIRCVSNPTPNSLLPSQIVASEVVKS